MKDLCIGIPHVERGEDYLGQTLRSLFARDEAMANTVVLICDFGTAPSRNLAAVRLAFAGPLADGSLILERFQGPRPPLDGLRRNFGDDPERVHWRSKQVWDASWLMARCQGLARYYLHLEDDVVVAPGYRGEFRDLAPVGDAWGSVKLCRQGACAVLFHDEDLGKVSAYLQAVYDEMPLDWLLDHFSALKQRTGYPTLLHPGYFTHIGTHSTLRGQLRLTVDEKRRQAS